MVATPSCTRQRPASEIVTASVGRSFTALMSTSVAHEGCLTRLSALRSHTSCSRRSLESIAYRGCPAIYRYFKHKLTSE